MNEQNKLSLIPKSENYAQYMLDIIIKLPRVEKFSIGTEYKQSMYQMIEFILYFNKCKNSELYYLNKIDCLLTLQRIYLRIMKNNRWINEEKFQISIDKIGELGKIVGGLLKHYGKVDKK